MLQLLLKLGAGILPWEDILTSLKASIEAFEKEKTKQNAIALGINQSLLAEKLNLENYGEIGSQEEFDAIQEGIKDRIRTYVSKDLGMSKEEYLAKISTPEGGAELMKMAVEKMNKKLAGEDQKHEGSNNPVIETQP